MGQNNLRVWTPIVKILPIFLLSVDHQTGPWRVWLLWFARFSFICLFLLISLISLVSGDVGDVEAMGIDDKVAHILAYISIMGAGLFSVADARYRPKIFAALLIYGVGLEFGQQIFVAGREGSVADALANLLGLLLGLFLSKPVSQMFCRLGKIWTAPAP